MALKPCKECGREISTEAKTCPHCGKQWPTGKPTSPFAIGCLGLLGLAVVGSLMSTGGSSSNTSAGSTPSPALASTASTDPTPGSLPSAPPPVGSQWSYSHDTDEMSGKVTHSAQVQSDNSVEFGFPYQGSQHGRLLIRRHPRFGHDVIFSIERGQLLCPSYEGCTVLVRFDEDEAQHFDATGAADHSTETLFIQNYDRFVARLRKAKRVRISPQVYQQGNVVFTFDVSGFDAAQFRGS